VASVTINVLDPEFYVDPWQAYRWLRDEAPLYWDPVQKLLRRMPDWELADADEPRIVPATFTRAYDRIRIRFTPSRP
jgi:hypothetical protein